MKLGSSKPEAPAPAPSVPDSAPMDLGGDPSANPEPPKDDKPFDDTPFDAGVEADEESDPKKFIEQLTGKLGQSLRKYNEAQGQPDFELEKFAINSLLSATHTSEMDNEDQEDIIKKVKEAGKGDDDVAPEDAGNDVGNNGSTDDGNSEFSGTGGENPPPPPSAPAPPVAENEEIKDDSFLIKPKKLSIFAPEGSEEANYKHKIVEKLHETLNQEDMTEPMVEPQVKPAPADPKRIETEPIAPSRKNKPFLPMPNVKPDPKAKN